MSILRIIVSADVCTGLFLSLEGGMPMKQFKDLNKKRVCDISDDRKTLYIRRGDCVTEVRAEKDGTLSIECRKEPQAS